MHTSINKIESQKYVKRPQKSMDAEPWPGATVTSQSSQPRTANFVLSYD